MQSHGPAESFTLDKIDLLDLYIPCEGMTMAGRGPIISSPSPNPGFLSSLSVMPAYLEMHPPERIIQFLSMDYTWTVISYHLMKHQYHLAFLLY